MMNAALRTLLCEKASSFGVELSGEQVDKFDKYGDLLLSWNEKMNLTAIRDPEGVVIRHFIDSLSLLSVMPLSGEEKVIDVGTGAGFPGIPLLIARPTIQLTLLDSLNKRLVFLQAVLDELALSATPSMPVPKKAGVKKNCGNTSIWPPPGRWQRCRFCANTACPLSNKAGTLWR